MAIDTSRLAASVVTGVGFLGGGAILRTGINVRSIVARDPEHREQDWHRLQEHTD